MTKNLVSVVIPAKDLQVGDLIKEYSTNNKISWTVCDSAGGRVTRINGNSAYVDCGGFWYTDAECRFYKVERMVENQQNTAEDKMFWSDAFSKMNSTSLYSKEIELGMAHPSRALTTFESNAWSEALRQKIKASEEKSKQAVLVQREFEDYE